MEQLLAKIKVFIAQLNEKGIPTPIFRDMLTKQVSITYTMFLISFVLVILSLFTFGGEKLGLKFDQCLELLGYTGIGYIGRKFQKGTMTIEGKESTDETKVN